MIGGILEALALMAATAGVVAGLVAMVRIAGDVLDHLGGGSSARSAKRAGGGRRERSITP